MINIENKILLNENDIQTVTIEDDCIHVIFKAGNVIDIHSQDVVGVRFTVKDIKKAFKKIAKVSNG